jgi:hypothetical protein
MESINPAESGHSAEPLIVQYPSADFPPPPAFRLVIPADWEAVPYPDAEMAVRSREPVAGFHPNVVVRVLRTPATATPADDLERAVSSERQRPGVEVALDEALTEGGPPSRRMVLRYLAPDATLLESHHLSIYVPATEHVAMVVSAVGTWAAASPDAVRDGVRSIVESLLVRVAVPTGGG